MDLGLVGKLAIITGGSEGIGKAVATVSIAARIASLLLFRPSYLAVTGSVHPLW